MSTSPDDKNADLKQAERARLSKLPDFPARSKDEIGVLLSDRIKFYCQDEYKLISPFDESLLRSAGYDLTVGRNYSKLGQQAALNEGMELEIDPYQVAIIETYETINMPPFLIGRWNIRVKLAYKGLLWVGGAQVDPGFRGCLCCPIYNLSTEKVVLKFRDPLAMIDFVTTTPFSEDGCKRFPWASRNMLVFPDYPALNSGIEAEVDKFKTTIEDARKDNLTQVSKIREETGRELKSREEITSRSVGEINRRIDTFLTLVFTVVAVLFTGLGIVATTRPDERSFVNPPVWIASIALYFALRSSRSSEPEKDVWYSRRFAALLIAGALLFAGIAYHAWDTGVSFNDLTEAKKQADAAVKFADGEKQAREKAIEDLQRQSNAKFDDIDRQLKRLQSPQAKTK